MGERLEKKFRLTMSWDYEKEEQWLNEMSSQGLHFKKAGFFNSSFVRNKSVRYTYGLDHQSGLTKKDGKLAEYIALYQDAGWEYVTSFGALWHYFRREWQPGEQPKLYTDVESLTTIYKNIQRVMGLMLLVNAVILIANMSNLLSHFKNALWAIMIPVSVIYVLIFALLGYGYVKMGSKIKKLNN
ncbi:DUF2812 domain-containing protein [Paenibacillus luteus]|uniref:DUF2812 domain-containing protein n=1 Tax=Paenibacillus luteus TaxID=2545753 RepID=UPI001144FC3D|nr:DUF2812 domain-containing protein [Paenibacillus luteus]